MKKFLLKTILSALYLMLILILIPVFLDIFSNLRTDYYSINSDINTIFMGDSHMQRAIVDSLLSNSINLSRPAESYYFTYYKLQKILKTNKHIEKVYLGFGYHNFSHYFNRHLMGDDSHYIGPTYFYSLPLVEKLVNIYWNIDDIHYYYKSIFNQGVFDEFLSKGNLSSTYFNVSDSIENEEIENAIHSQFYENSKNEPYSCINIKYLSKIIRLCHLSDVELILLNTPLHEDYKKLIPKNYIDKYNEFVSEYDLQIRYADSLELSNDCFMKDGSHLSIKGAEIYTEYLIKRKILK